MKKIVVRRVIRNKKKKKKKQRELSFENKTKKLKKSVFIQNVHNLHPQSHKT